MNVYLGKVRAGSSPSLEDMRRKLTLVGAAAALVVGVATPSYAASTNTVGWWQLNEPAGASIAFDSSGNALNATVGSDVETGVSFGNRVGYRFPYISGSAGPRPEHILQVPESSLLDPDLAQFTVSLRFRTTHAYANLVQKGQSNMAGGYWKVDMRSGVLTCLFRDGAGGQSTTSTRVRINDGAWHTIKCTRTTSSVVMYVDGLWRDTRPNPTSSINNTAPLTIAGKPFCGGSVGCDYWSGDLDFVRINKG